MTMLNSCQHEIPPLQNDMVQIILRITEPEIEK